MKVHNCIYTIDLWNKRHHSIFDDSSIKPGVKCTCKSHRILLYSSCYRFTYSTEFDEKKEWMTDEGSETKSQEIICGNDASTVH